jgi:hypothetical protein
MSINWDINWDISDGVISDGQTKHRANKILDERIYMCIMSSYILNSGN